MKNIFISFLLILVSCRGMIKKTTEEVVLNNETRSFIPSRVDSIDILYFKKPFVDEERYQRFFSVAHTSDSLLIDALRSAMEKSVQQDLQSPKECRSEGKMIIPLGADAFKVIYFSRNETNCPYLYVIENGHFLYYKMDTLLNSALNRLESVATEP